MIEDLPLGIAPLHVFIALVASAIGVMGFLWKITKSMANIEMKVNFMWRDFQKRYKFNGEE